MKIINVSEPVIEAAKLRRAAPIPDSFFADAITIMKGVAEHGDSAVLDYTVKFDGVKLDSPRVSKEEIKQAYGQVTKEQVKAVRLMKDRLAKSEAALLKRLKGISVSSDGVKIERTIKPIE